MKILIDPGHGLNTSGKRSPDGEFREAVYTREIAGRIVADLKDRGYDAELLVPESEDISLEDSVSRINVHCETLGKSNVVLLSIHVNAAGNGSVRQVGHAAPAKVKLNPTNSQPAYMNQPQSSSKIVKSAQNMPVTVIPIGKKISISSVNPIAWQYCQRTFILIIYQTWSICRARPVSKPSSIHT